MTPPLETPVVVVGAGPTGLLSAALLARHGIGCLVLDRWPATHPQPRAVHLDDEVVRVLGSVGLAEPFLAVSRPALGLRLLDREHAVIAEFARDRESGVHGFPQANMFDQPELEDLLRGAVARFPAARVLPNSVATGIVQHGDRVDVRYEDRLTGTGGVVTARYVLGCDGANSLVRACISASMKNLGFAQRWLVVDVDTDAELRQWEGVHQVCDPVRAATYMRIGPTRYRWEFRLLPHETAADLGTLDRVMPLIEPWTGTVPRDALTLVRAAEYTFTAQVADRWRDRRVFILGDAAHLTPPFIGQGLGAGLRDAANLSWKLAGVLQGTLPEACLDTYESERKPHARAMVRLAVTVGQAMTAGGRTGDALRRAVAPRVQLVPALRGRILDGTTPPLRTSPRPSLRHRRLRGALCPATLLQHDDDSFPDREPGFWVLTRVPCPTTLEQEITARGGAVRTDLGGGALDRWLRAGRADAAVIRPDGTVFAAGRDLRGLVSALPGFPLTELETR